MPDPSRVIALVEDERHEMLVRRYLRRCGMEPRQIRFERSPSGKGSAEQWVRTRFPKEVSAYRRRAATAATALIIMIDADAHTVQDRLTQLAQILVESEIPPIGNGEEVVRLIPKRNVETWIVCLEGTVVNEEMDYKHAKEDWNKVIPIISETLFRWTRPNFEVPGHCIDSLRRGLSELKRLNF